MEYTSEHLKVFLFTGIIASSSIAILFSSGQFDTTKFAFESEITIEKANEMAYMTYVIHNTGNTDIVSILVDADCCSTSPDNPTYYPILPRNNTGQISTMLSFDGGVMEIGEDIKITFQVEDNLGHGKPEIKFIKLE